MKTFAKTLSIALALAFASLSASAQQQTFTVNPEQSSVAFGLTGTGHEVHGTFHVSSGAIQFDRTAAQISGSIVVSAASGDSGDKGRDKNMHNAVLDVERAQQCMLVTLLQRTWFQRRDSKGLRHVHFIWYVPRSVDLVARLESTGCRLPETADELDSVAVVPFAILTNATERRRWKIRPQCDSALDLYVKEVRPH